MNQPLSNRAYATEAAICTANPTPTNKKPNPASATHRDINDICR
jgi:hypothetical protein